MQKSRHAIAVAVLAIGALSLGGCATKKFVRTQVGVVDTQLKTTQTQVTAQQGKLDAHEQRMGQIDQTTRDAMDRANAANKLAEGKFTYTVVLSDDSVKFPLNSAKLSPEAESRLTAFAQKLKDDNRNVYVEIQGHTDSREGKRAGMKLGEARADAVRMFLSKQGVALNRMSAISYAADTPAAPNTTAAGRAQNRRVVVIVLS